MKNSFFTIIAILVGTVWPLFNVPFVLAQTPECGPPTNIPCPTYFPDPAAATQPSSTGAGTVLAPPTTTPNNAPNQAAPGVQSGFSALVPIPGLTDTSNTSVVNSDSLANFFNNLYKYLIGLSAILAIIMIIWGGIEIAFNQESISSVLEGKGKVRNAIYGLILVLSPALIFSIINPSILNLSVNLPALDTATAPASGSGGTANIPMATSTTQCTTLQSDKYLETAVCPSKALAQAYTCGNGGGLRFLFKASCLHFNPNTNTCEDKFPVICEGESVTVVYYNSTHLFGLRNGDDSKVIPRDAQVESSFNTICAADGGSVTKLAKGSSYNCPADAQLPTVSENDQYGFTCNNEELTCSRSSYPY